MQEKFNISGMTCSACSSAVERAIKKLEGVNSVSVNLLTNSMMLDYNNEQIANKDIVKAVEDAGYGVILKEDKISGQKELSEDKVFTFEQEKIKKYLYLSIIFLIPLFYISMGSMLGFPQLKILLGHENSLIMAFTQLLLTTPILIINRRFFVNGFKSLARRAPNMDSLIAIGAAAAYIYGILAIYMISYGFGHNNMGLVMKYGHELYFESAAMILTLITLGKYLEAKAKGKTTDAISKLMDLTPKFAQVERNGIEIQTAISDIILGDIVVIRPGGNIPVDGVIVEGQTTIDESALTGESMPLDKNVGDKIYAATTNLNGFVKIKAEKVGEDRTISKIIKLVEDANATKAPIAQLADKVSGVFVPFVIMISIIAGTFWYLRSGNFEFALGIAISVLVISCPCALGLATPVAIMVGTGKGAKMGILYKSAESLEILHNSKVVILDKTGTITEGKPELTNILLINKDIKSFMEKAVTLEKGSEHPLSKAITDYGKEIKVESKKIENFKTLTGMGVEGIINGRKYIAGNKKLMAENNISLKKVVKYAEQFSEMGKTVLYFAEEGKLIGIVAIADTIKEGSKKAIELLQNEKIKVAMITGDNETTAKAIGEQLKLDKIVGEVLPQDKDSIVKSYQEEGYVVTMVGDGINDAPALARADVGIAIGAGTDIAIESGDIVLMKSQLTDIVNAIDLSKATIKTIKENLFWAFFYNTLGIPIAAGVFYESLGLKLNPMLGAFAMSISSLFVVSNALRLNYFKPKLQFTQLDSSRVKSKVKVEEIIIDYKEENNSEVKKVEKIIKIQGMSCGHCKKRVEDTLNTLEGVHAVVDLDNKEARVSMDMEVSEDTLIKVVTDLGYEVVEVK